MGFLRQPLVCLALAGLVACKPTAPEEQSALRGKAPPAVSLGVSPNADSAANPASPRAAASAGAAAGAVAAAPTADAGVDSGPVGEPIGKGGFRDSFDRAELGPDWLAEGREFRLEGGQLVTRDTRNRGLWLRRPLPRDVRIEFTARAEAEGADIKVEVFGDGRAAQPTTGYIVIFGGWGNTLNVIARLDESGADRVIGPSRPIVKGKTYRMRIERRGRVIAAYVDDQLMARLDDPQPLDGPRHRFFAFSGWLSELRYDNLVITPL